MTLQKKLDDMGDRLKFDALKKEHEALKKRNVELVEALDKTSEQLENGRNYLMGVDYNEITPENALEAFGFGRNGYKNI